MPLKEARVGVYDLGLLRAFGIYEGIAAVKGEPFHFHDHFARFEKSAKALGLTLPFSEDETLQAMREVVAHNAGVERATVRMILTGGEAEGGIVHVEGRETFYILAELAERLPEKIYAEGGSLITTEHQRAMPEYKTVDYITAVMLQPKRKAAGAVDILYVNQGEVLECGGSNIFIVKDGALVTPKERVLPGITRKVVLDLAGGVYPTTERAVTLEELLAADEVFMTGSFKDIVPIVKIDSTVVGKGVGPLTRDLMARFKKYAGL